MKSRIAPLFRRLPNGSRVFAHGLLALALFAICGSAGAQVSFTGVYTENFNGMGTSGTAAPTGWGFYGNLGGDNNTWVSSIPATDAGLGTLNATLIASTSTSVTSNTQGYNRADAGSTADRSLGSSPTSGRGVAWQLSLSNLTGAPLNALGLRYDTRRFNAPTTANDLPGHWVFYSLDNGATWINVSSLNPSITTVPNTTGTSVFVERNLTLASAWAANATLLLRWIDDNATQSSPDQIVGIDNVAISSAPPAADSAVVFVDGQHVTMGAAAALGVSSFTIECWFLRTGSGTTTTTGSGGVTAVPLIAKGRGEADGDNRDCNYFLGINAAGNLAADFEQFSATNNGIAYNAGQNFPVVGSSVVQSGVWNHAAATYDATTAQWKLYLNGVAETLTVPVGSPATFVGVAPRNDSIQHFAIGTAMNSAGAREGAFNGVIDEVRVWNVARSGTQIASAKDAAITTAETGLLGRYGLNEGTGTTAAAVPVTAPSGTLSGSPLWTNGFNAAGVVPPSVTLTSPLEGASFNLPATVNLAATAADTGGSVAKVEFFAGATKLGEDSEEPYTYNWSGMISGNYVLTARATDNEGASTNSSAVNITIANPNNVAPSVTLNAPVNGTQIAGSSTTLAATAADTDGVVAKVEFFSGASKLGEDTAAPYTYNWTGVGTGTYSVTARATDNDGASVNSAPASVTFVVPVETTAISRRPAGQPGALWKYLDNGSNQGTAWKEPTFDDSTWASGAAPLGYTDSHIVTTVFSPAQPNRYITTYFRRNFSITGAGAVQSLKLNVLRDDGVVVYINGVEVARQNMPEGPITHLTNSATITDGANETTYFTSDITTLPPLNEGDNVIAVELHQRDGNSSDLGFDLELITNSLPGTPPTIELTAPADGASYTAPATVAIAADAEDTDGSVAKVEFFNGTEKLGEDVNAPYTFDWTVVPQGNYTLTAKATDNYGLSTTSDPVAINVGPPNTIFPTVTITGPVNNAGFLAPASIDITVDANDTDGTVTKVEFFQGTTKLGEDALAPYTYPWSNVPVGSYVLTARATDNLTAATVSAPVNVVVAPNLPPSVTLSTPLDGATGLAGGGRVNLTANVSDPEGLPLNVTFYGRPKSAPPGENFTLVTLPDTQFYSENTGGSRFALFQSQTNWIVATKDLLKTKFVSHMGDMVNTASVAQEWTNAKAAMSLIEDPLTTLLAQGMPWGGAPGNHDGTGSEWDTHFGPSRFAGRNYYQGNYNNSNRNNYQFFSAGGMDFVILHLDYNSNTAGNQAIMDWADAVLKANPNRRAIVTSHWLISTGNPASWGGHGQALYDNLKDNPNLFLMLCGHIHGEGRRSDVFQGRTVNTVLQDYQSRTNGGDSWLRYFTFKPSENKIYAYTYKTDTTPVNNPLGGTFETDADSQFTLDYNMASTAPWTDLGTVSLAAGATTATLPWTGLVNGEGYEWYAAVSDGVTPMGSAPRSFTATGNAAPTITLNSPSNGATITRPAKVEFAATAADLDGTIAKVEFYNGTTKVGEDTTAPYTYSWDAPSGSHGVTAKAIDGEGATADSTAANVTVNFDIEVTITGGSSGPAGTVTGGTGLVVGSNANFVATPNAGFSFSHWIVNGAPAGSNPNLTVAVTDGMTVEAVFSRSNFTLQLLHFADGEAGLLASQTAPNLAALVDAFDGTYANTIILAGGDNYIPGPFAAAGTDAIVAATHNKGNNPFAADIEIHIRIGVQASTVGNHEFDFGANAFSDAIIDAIFPYRTANLNVSGDSGISARYQETVGVGGLEEASTLPKKVGPSAVITVNGEKIGLVGATTQIIETISSTGGVEVKGFTGD
ncbi:MAG: Ig-like domain-containing protein, partial [Verrucomicrobiales bacterium]|nr:Ig-like domain-containing protein [Verrucomicrobiales bacterium]